MMIIWIVIKIIMSQQKIKLSIEQKSLGKILKILSKASSVRTNEIRKDMRNLNTQNKQRVNQNDLKNMLIKPRKQVSMPNILFTYKLFEDRGNKLANIKQKIIESQAFSKRADFQYRKIQNKKQKIAKKQHLSLEKNKVSHLITPKLQQKDIKNLRISQVFQKLAINQNQSQKNKRVIRRVKNTLISSKNRVRSLYNQHYSSLNALNPQNKINLNSPQIVRLNSNITNTLDAQQTNTPRNQFHQISQNGYIKTQSVIIRKPEPFSRRKQSLIDLIEMSRITSKNKQQSLDQRQTSKEIQEINACKNLTHSLRQEIDRQNKLRESIIFGGLKKLIYGDRRGRFIQDNTFKTRLQGQNSIEYCNILRQQEDILQNFKGSVVNRRKMAQKFSNILGTINKHEKNVHQEKYKY